jgi:DNA-binding response OmpR family regulator
MIQPNLLSHIRLLYVEDEADTREEFSKFLKRRVGKLMVAENGLDGLKHFEDFHPDIILTDLRMPGLTGLEMIRALRGKGYKTPVIILSALSDSDTLLEAVDLGIVKYHVKPIDTDTLVNQLEILAEEVLRASVRTTLAGKTLIGPEEKQALEKSLRGEISAFIKEHTGKGPRDLQAFIHGGRLEITAKGTLTPLEKSILVNRQNTKLVEYSRRVFYLESRAALEAAVASVLGAPCTLEEVLIDSGKETDVLVLKF